MEMVKVRRVGNSDMVSLPRALKVTGFAPGTTVAIDVIDTNTVVLKALPDDDQRARVRDAIRASIQRSAKALELLEEYDSAPESPASEPSRRRG
ncbi:MAG TPA: hypothetical protein VIR57_03955 [Chloroflexota bacterium]|jgi:antitoxin component of MazEF toxin-antitoxin module